MDRLLYELSKTLDTLDSRDAIMQAMDRIDAVYDALDEIQQELADEVMNRLLRRLEALGDAALGKT